MTLGVFRSTYGLISFNWGTLLNWGENVKEETDCINIGLTALRDVRNISASEFGYGAQRHLELPLALGQDPLLIMLDEPTAGLSVHERRKSLLNVFLIFLRRKVFFIHPRYAITS